MDMLRRGSRLAVALAAVALVTLCPASRADEHEAPPKRAASLGLATSRITESWREKNAYRASGVLVVGVDPSGRAAKSGISAGDVLVSVDGRTLREPSDLGYAERSLSASKPVAIVLARDGGHSIKMFDIAPITDAGPGVSAVSGAAAMDSGIATEPIPQATATETATTPEPSGSSFITDSSPFGGAVATAPEGGTPNSVEPGPAIIIARADTDGAPAEKPAGAKSGAEELGVRAQPLTPDLATALGSEGAEGVLVLEVGKETPADHAGLRAGDIIFKIGELAVKDMETLDQAVAAATNPAAISMLRRGDQQMVLAPLEGHPSPANELVPAAAAPADQEQVINALKDEVATLKKELADLKEQIAKLVAESAKK